MNVASQNQESLGEHYKEYQIRWCNQSQSVVLTLNLLPEIKGFIGWGIVVTQ